MGSWDWILGLAGTRLRPKWWLLLEEMQDLGGLNPGDRMALTLLHLRTQVKLFHWQTKSYSEHKALDGLGKRLLDLNDRWVEAYQGNEQTRVRCGGCSLELHDWVPGAAQAYLKDRERAIRARREAHFSGPDQEYLANILDEIEAALGRASFLLTLK